MTRYRISTLDISPFSAMSIIYSICVSDILFARYKFAGQPTNLYFFRVRSHLELQMSTPDVLDVKDTKRRAPRDYVIEVHLLLSHAVTDRYLDQFNRWGGARWDRGKR